MLSTISLRNLNALIKVENVHTVSSAQSEQSAQFLNINH